MIEIYIGLGSNLNHPTEQIRQARLSLANIRQIKELGFSSLYVSPPMGPADQPDYINAVMRAETDLSPSKLLAVLQGIENDFGRIRHQRWGARVLDLDLLLYGDKTINQSDLTVPHYGLSQRAFVLYPLQDVAPDDLLIPQQGSLKTLVTNCPLNGLEKLS